MASICNQKFNEHTYIPQRHNFFALNGSPLIDLVMHINFPQK